MTIPRLALSIILLLCLAACAAMDTTPSERALALTQQYQSMEDTYKSQYRAAYKQEREWLRQNVAPILDEARQVLQSYNSAVLSGDSATDERLELLRLLRQVNQRLLETDNEAQ